MIVIIPHQLFGRESLPAPLFFRLGYHSEVWELNEGTHNISLRFVAQQFVAQKSLEGSSVVNCICGHKKEKKKSRPNQRVDSGSELVSSGDRSMQSRRRLYDATFQLFFPKQSPISITPVVSIKKKCALSVVCLLIVNSCRHAFMRFC